MEQHERTRALVGECISRTHVDTARGASLDDIAAACDACDYERAATLALGRARAGDAVPVETVMRILPGIELPAITLALIAIVPGGRPGGARARLLELVEQHRFPQTKDAAELEAIVVFAAWRAGAETTRIIPELRRLSARQMSVESYALLATVAAAIEDANVATATKPIAGFAKEYAKQVSEDDRALNASLDAVIASLPAEVETTRAAGFTVRTGKQVGRNDPCPCGSGLKYKRCCADKQDVKATPSPIQGVTWDEFLVGDRIAPEHVDELALRDLVRVDFARLAPMALAAVLHRLITAREWTHAERAVEAAHPDARDEFRDELVVWLLEAGQLERARSHVAQLPPDLAKLFELELAIADGAQAAWPALVRAAREAAVDRVAAVDLGYALLRAEPALGIVAARACIGALQVDDPDILLDMVEDARDKLNIPPDDPAWDVLEELTDRSRHKKTEAEDKLRVSLAESSARVDQLERMLSALRTELDAARTRPAAELMRAPEERGRLDERVRELEGLIREGNAERRELRKQLESTATAEPAETPARREGPRARRVTLEEDDDDVGDNVELGARNIAIPRFERRAVDALASVPAAVASETMRTIGNLAAGDGFAWRSVKQAKDMVRPILMARVGIHHRVLFRVEDGALDVVDVVTREQLLTTLKRLRASR